MDKHGELYKFSEQEIENLIGIYQEILSNDDILKFCRSIRQYAF